MGDVSENAMQFFCIARRNLLCSMCSICLFFLVVNALSNCNTLDLTKTVSYKYHYNLSWHNILLLIYRADYLPELCTQKVYLVTPQKRFMKTKTRSFKTGGRLFVDRV